ncbi:hypothetical protein ASZ90_004563 [hydrocarbon metagenome]|uniref:Uncharacterized protein n=1 Tax=hydrocarbon metagenome TaxID=938273 RepID=A0A0W8FXL0_9ZZZZ
MLISKIISSFSTLSPSFLCHFIMVPSITDSPILGIGISISSPPTCVVDDSSLRVSSFILSDSSSTASPFVSITATTEPASTVSFSNTLISERIPFSGLGISVSTLSVLISNMISSFSTLSPFFLCHLIIVPSLTLSPILGITTSTFILVFLYIQF